MAHQLSGRGKDDVVLQVLIRDFRYMLLALGVVSFGLAFAYGQLWKLIFLLLITLLFYWMVTIIAKNEARKPITKKYVLNKHRASSLSAVIGIGLLNLTLVLVMLWLSTRGWAPFYGLGAGLLIFTAWGIICYGRRQQILTQINRTPEKDVKLLWLRGVSTNYALFFVIPAILDIYYHIIDLPRMHFLIFLAGYYLLVVGLLYYGLRSYLTRTST